MERGHPRLIEVAEARGRYGDWRCRPRPAPIRSRATDHSQRLKKDEIGPAHSPDNRRASSGTSGCSNNMSRRHVISSRILRRGGIESSGSFAAAGSTPRLGHSSSAPLSASQGSIAIERNQLSGARAHRANMSNPDEAVPWVRGSCEELVLEKAADGQRKLAGRTSADRLQARRSPTREAGSMRSAMRPSSAWPRHGTLDGRVGVSSQKPRPFRRRISKSLVANVGDRTNRTPKSVAMKSSRMPSARRWRSPRAKRASPFDLFADHG